MTSESLDIAVKRARAALKAIMQDDGGTGEAGEIAMLATVLAHEEAVTAGYVGYSTALQIVGREIAKLEARNAERRRGWILVNEALGARVGGIER